MRAQGLISSKNRGMNSNSSSGNNANESFNSNANSRSPQSKTQTPTSPASPKLPISTLKGFFAAPNRPRTPSLIGSNGNARTDEPSSLQSSFSSTPPHPLPTTSASTHILNRLRGNSDARPLSPLGYTPSVASISTAANNHSGVSDPPMTSAELERKILPDQTDVTTNGTSGANRTITQRRQSPISQQLAGLNGSGLVNLVSSPLQPPPWRKQSTGSPITQSLPQSQVDLSEPNSGTYQYLHTNMSAVESFGVHHTHPPSRRSMNGARPSLDISSGRESQKSGSGTGAGGSVKGSLGVGGGEKKQRPPSWTSTSSNNESVAGGPKRWSRQGVLPKRLTPPSGALPSIPVSGGEEESITPRIASPHPYSFDRERSPSRSSSYSNQDSPANSMLNSNANSPQNGFSAASFLKRQSGSSFQSGTSMSNVSSQVHTRTSTGSGTGNSVGSYIPRPALSIQNRLSLAPPQRPAPNTALPPTPMEQESQLSSPGMLNPGPPSPPPSSKSSFRESLTQRALRLSLAGLPQKTPPTTNLPPRPDDPAFAEGHRRSNSIGGNSVGGTSRPTTLYTIPGSPSPASGDPDLLPPAYEKERQQNTLNLNLKQRLRMLSAPASTTVPTDPLPATPPSNSSVSAQLLAADQAIIKPHTEGDSNYGSVHTRLLVGEPITTMQNDPSFLLMNTPPISPPIPTRLSGQYSSRPSSAFIPSNPSSPLPTQTQFPSSSMLPPPSPQYPAHPQRSPQLAPLPVPPRSPFRQLPKPPSPTPSQNSRSQSLPPAQLIPEITSLSPPPWTAARRTSVIPAMPPKGDSAEAEQKDDRPPPTFMDSPPLLTPRTSPPLPFTPQMSSADSHSITNLSI